MSRGQNDASDSDEPFLARWSRRKLRQDETGEASPGRDASSSPQPSGRELPVAPEKPVNDLPSLESLDGLKSDYQAFMQTGVADATRRTALKKLFSDPHFNVMDGLDTYIDDYSIEDPIPDAMLRGLNQARSMMLFEEKEEPAQSQADGAGIAQPLPAASGATQALPDGAPTAADPPREAELGPVDIAPVAKDKR